MLNCMATCRSADKKPHDNIPKEPAISQLANNTLSNAFGGGMTKEAIDELVGGTQAFKEASSLLNTVKATNNIGNVASVTSKLASSLVPSAFMPEILGLGKALCPSVR